MVIQLETWIDYKYFHANLEVNPPPKMSIENVYIGIITFFTVLLVTFVITVFIHYTGIVFFEHGYEYNLTTLPSRLGWDIFHGIMSYDFNVGLIVALPIGILGGIFGA